MASSAEIRFIQTGQLFKLLQLKDEMQKDNKGKEIVFDSLRKLIAETKATMTQEEVAWVEKSIAELQ